MAVYEGSEQGHVAATPEACFAALTDYEALSSWQGAVSRCEVISRDEAGRGLEVLYEVDARIRTVSYRLRHHYEEPSFIGSEYVEGDFRHFQGDWRFEAAPEGALVTVTARIDPGLRLPGRLVKVVNERVLRRSVDDLRRQLEG